MIPYTHYLNMYFDGGIAGAPIEEGAPVMPAADGLVVPATPDAKTVWIANQSATPAGDTNFYQNHTTPTMKVGEPIECLIKGVRTARVVGPVTFGMELVPSDSETAFEAAGAGVEGKAVALFDDPTVGVVTGPVQLK